MDFSTVIYILVSLFLIVDGIYSAIKGAPIFPGNNDKVQREKYADTYHQAHKVFGLGLAIGGICFLIHGGADLFNWFDSYILLFIGLAFVIIGLIFYYLVLKGTIKINTNRAASQNTINQTSSQNKTNKYFSQKEAKPKKEKSDDGISGYNN